MSLSSSDESVQSCFLLVRGHLVLLQTDLARLLGVPPDRLLSHVHLFPGEFCFPLEPPEIAELVAEQGDERQPLHAFSEHGALLAAFLLNTPEAVAMGVEITRAFVRFRLQALHPHALAFAGA